MNEIELMDTSCALVFHVDNVRRRGSKAAHLRPPVVRAHPTQPLAWHEFSGTTLRVWRPKTHRLALFLCGDVARYLVVESIQFVAVDTDECPGFSASRIYESI